MFNALELMENGDVFSNLNFMRGDGNLHYYLYNYGVAQFEGNLNGLVLF